MRNIQRLTTLPRRVTVLLAAGAVLSVSACGGDTSAPSLRKDVLWDVSAVPLAVSLAVGDTFTVGAQPLDYDGNVMTDDVSVSYKSSDTTRVAVDHMGVVTALKSTAGQGVTITLGVRAGAVTKSTQVIFGVTETPVDVDSMSLEPTSGGLVVPIGASAVFKARLFDSNGSEVFGVHTRSVAVEDTADAFSASQTSVFPRGPGSVKIIGSVLVNRKLVSDSITYRSKWREYADLTISRGTDSILTARLAGMYTTNVYISPNGQMDVVNNLNTPIDVVFERPADAKGSETGIAGGNITALQPGARTSRWFPALGDYVFTIQTGTESKGLSVSVKD